MNPKKIVILTAKSCHFSLILGLLGPAAVTDLGLDRKQDSVKFVAAIDETKLSAEGTLVGLPNDVKLTVKDLDEDGTVKSKLKKDKYAAIGTIERRNGMYAITGDKDLAASPAFLQVMDQVKNKQAPAFDTAFAHTSGPKNTWIGKTGRNARPAHINSTSITSSRFSHLGIVLSADKSDDVKMVDWATLDNWFETATGGSNISDYQEIYSGDGNVRSLSHVNNGRLVVNTGNGKTVLDLSALNTDPMAKIVSKDVSDLGSNLVGLYPGSQGTVAFVDELTDDTETSAAIRFVPTSSLPRELRQDYAQAAA